MARYAELIPMVSDRNPDLVNPASIDVRVGKNIILDDNKIDISRFDADHPFALFRHDFVLVETQEILAVPLDLAMELKLKSSRAREGYNHSLAFWFDPGWVGRGTMELTCLVHGLPLYPGLRMAQLIYHKLDQVCAKPYTGKYNGATGVEQAKADNKI